MAASDPIFHRPEPEPPARRRTLLLWQYFLFPLLIVVVALGIFLVFGLLGRDDDTPQGLLSTVLEGGENRQQQASQQLAIHIATERARADAAREAGQLPDPAPFYAAPEFIAGLRRAFALAIEEESDERQEALARALGRAEVAAAIPDLLAVALGGLPEGVAAGKPSPSSEVRRSAAVGLLHFESRPAEEAYTRLATESDDPEIRTMGLNGLALLGLARHGGAARDGPRVREILLGALDHAHGGVRVNAAWALAMRGNAAGRHLVEQSLTREGLRELNVTEPKFQVAALANGITAAAALRDESLKPLVARLAMDAHESDDQVRRLAREALARWSPDGGS